jgi:hypothetical protein
MTDEASHQNSAISCYRRKDLQAALRHLDAARAAGELDKQGCVLLIQVYLLLGHWRTGWEFLAECCRNDIFVTSPYSAARWNGQPLNGKRIVVWGGGGFGDEILYVRYLPRLADLGPVIYLDCDGPLVDLFRSVRGAGHVGDFRGAVDCADYQITTTELPLYFGGADGGPWPEPGPYFRIDAPERPPARLRVGIAWAANHRHRGGEERSAALTDMACLWSVSSARFYSLQVGASAALAGSAPAGITIEPLSEGIPTFAEQARQILSLDLVITVDTAVANLAGALGARTWVAVPEIPNWRWGLAGPSTPWYPSVRIYRRESTGGWPAVFAKMARDLAAFDRG